MCCHAAHTKLAVWACRRPQQKMVWARVEGRCAAAQVYTELVVGLGEAIVSGLVPGSALSSVAKKDALDNPRVRAQSHALLVACLASSLAFTSALSGYHVLLWVMRDKCSSMQAFMQCWGQICLCLPPNSDIRAQDVHCGHDRIWWGAAQVVMYPSKSDGMFVPESLIFRSDSNGARQPPGQRRDLCEGVKVASPWAKLLVLHSPWHLSSPEARAPPPEVQRCACAVSGRGILSGARFKGCW